MGVSNFSLGREKFVLKLTVKWFTFSTLIGRYGLCTILNDPDFCIIFICCAYWLDGLCFFAVSISELAGGVAKKLWILKILVLHRSVYCQIECILSTQNLYPSNIVPKAKPIIQASSFKTYQADLN